jgi:hypothetical protein
VDGFHGIYERQQTCYRVRTFDVLYCAPSFHRGLNSQICLLAAHLTFVRSVFVQAQTSPAGCRRRKPEPAVVVDGTITTACHRPRGSDSDARTNRSASPARMERYEAAVASTACNKCCGWAFLSSSINRGTLLLPIVAIGRPSGRIVQGSLLR